jgi:pimeloyl-ACP methyl ester carboxylesterase
LKKVLVKGVGILFNVVSYVNKKYAIEKALNLFARPRKGKVASFQSKFLDQGKRSKIVIDGIALSTYSYGRGPQKILLIHGWESNTWRWRKLIRFLGNEEYTFYSIDAPAHGDSEGKAFNMELLLRGINQLYNETLPDIIVGHSMGGMANLLHAAHFNIDSQVKLICLATPHSLAYIFGLYYDAIGIGDRIKQNTKQQFKEIYKMDLDYFDTTVHGHKIKSPLLILHDVDDNLNSIDCARAINKSIPHSTLVTVDNSNHSLQSPEIYGIVKDWIS